ncbi:MAG: ribulokinase [Firmicutes bacterium]|nr:ribulokinase [Bacillota bacterium]
MSRGKYVIGADFGTLSVRAAVVSVSDGSTAAQASFTYPHGVMEKDGFALADPGDYREGLFKVIKQAAEESGVPAEDIVAIGLDATSSTFVPVDEGGIPLCEKPGFSGRPHAWMKMWKHHHAQPEADELTRLAQDRGEAFLSRCGGKINAEWMLPKLLEIYRADREVYDAAAYFAEAGDQMVWELTGERTASAGPLGYKMLCSDSDPSIGPDYLNAAEEGFGSVLFKLPSKRVPLGKTAGLLKEDAAEKLGLCPGIPVAAANIDAHVTFAACGEAKENNMLLIIGTSCCTILLSREFRPVEGAFGILKDGVFPGFYGYESGQSAVGDTLAWFAENACGAGLREEASARGLSVHQLLTEKAEKLKAGQSGLLALDWWGGNRSILADSSLSGALFGLTLSTRPEEIYRALIEGMGFGLREIIEAYRRAGVPVEGLYASGGIAARNRMFLQIYSDITGLEIRRVRSSESSALGSAVFAAAAAGEERGGCADIFAASAAMGGLYEDVITPDPENKAVYDRLFAVWHDLHEKMGRDEASALKELHRIRSCS